MFRSSLLFWLPLYPLSLFFLILVSIYLESCKLEIFAFACQCSRSLNSGGTCAGLLYEYIALC
uniref:Uncharacterized protein n=1 Tax=Aotus nancymaae TaxID=37293 RepID=A0A2K5DU73_AOTNA